MREMTGVTDIFALPSTTHDAVCVTTNGCIKNNGRAVMGRGIALVADKKFNLSLALAQKLNQSGNIPYDMGFRHDMQTGKMRRIFTFPTKNYWSDPSSLALIKQSAELLVKLCDQECIQTCYLPRPGCTNGSLDWETQVRPVLANILDDRFVITDYR